MNDFLAGLIVGTIFVSIFSILIYRMIRDKDLGEIHRLKGDIRMLKLVRNSKQEGKGK